MPDQDKRGDPVAQDGRYEVAVMGHVFTMHPTQLRPSDLVCGLMEGSEDFGRRDGIERAMGTLIGAGLLYRSGAVVLPSVTALHFDGMPW